MAPYETMLKSTAYERMRGEHPAELAPANVFFTHDARSAIDRRNSFRVKAALVYEAITGHHVDDHMMRANRLLLALAKACHSAIYGPSRQKDPGDGTAKSEEFSKKEKKAVQAEGNELKNVEEISQLKKKVEGSEGDGGKKTEEINKQVKKVEGAGGDGAERTEEMSKQLKKVEGAEGDGAKSTEETSKQLKKVEGAEGDGAKKTEEMSRQLKKVEGAGPQKAASATEQQKDEKPELTDEFWDEEHQRVVDGIFLVVGFLPKLMDAIARSTDRDGVDERFKSHHMHDIVTDVIKLENQLPLRDLLDVVDVVERVINETEEVKQAKAESIVGGEIMLEFITRDSFDDVVHKFCWYYSPFFSKKPAAAGDGGPFKGVASVAKMVAERTLLDCLHQSVVPAPAPAGRAARVTGRPSRMPAARELRRSGVRLAASDHGRAEIQFKEQWATLQLPALVHDFKLATVVRNLLVLEYEEQSKPVTRYFQMMNELVEDVVDARILCRAGVVRGGSAGGQEVHELIKRIDGHATYPSVYMAMDREIETVKKYHEKRMNSFFVRNRPGVIWASSVAAISVVAIVAARKKLG